MENSVILGAFDKLVQDSIVFYDEDQKIVQHNEGKLTFSFVLTRALLKKPTFENKTEQSDQSKNEMQLRPGSDINTNGFEIGNVGESHVIVVNKFAFARPHLMLVSSDGYRRQFEPLDLIDLEAVWSSVMSMSNDYIAFYNCGRDSGCSRLHKHIQLMPMPTMSFASFLDIEGGKETEVPYIWAYKRFASGAITATNLVEIYNLLLKEATHVYTKATGKESSIQAGVAIPHNMILSKRWMVVLPRRQAAINKEAGANALGMLGVIAVATQNEIDNWVQSGLIESLKALGVPRF
ncbi:hypothetical protein VHEMI08250 [[Torrubiella] hemipterigena]|uniref:Uncharacterized protein n=1 Tax=[Torrubiella] hemipterigena TaxID=1531966 RepID=A0A0A1T636_9HYPO|nr:hypothetical protein VHEMI08250 [[Torrubiella] hemipterigena]